MNFKETFPPKSILITFRTNNEFQIEYNTAIMNYHYFVPHISFLNVIFDFRNQVYTFCYCFPHFAHVLISRIH